MRNLVSALGLVFTVGAVACAGEVVSEDINDSESELASRPTVIFSPQVSDASHLAKIATLIDGADKTIDIAMYSYSDARVSAALGRAQARGVKVRFLYEEGGSQNRLATEERARSTAGKLEAADVDVRFVNKIMHHKFMIVDGPKADARKASTARLVTGSANWSGSAATRFDENTLFLEGEAELALRFQREFNLLWDHSRDFVSRDFAADTAPLAITDAMITDRSTTHVFFTSSNFTVRDTTFSTNGENEVADALVAAIQSASTSIHIASGHLRSRPVSEALMEKKRTAPAVDIRVYLDGQEYISRTGHNEQEADVQACLAAATTDARRRACTDSGYLFGYAVGEAGIDVRYKYYAYRWDHSYAPQMHNKFMVVDGDELFTGSYNLSDNAEHNTFENMMMFKGTRYKPMIRSFEERFAALWETSRADAKLAALTTEVETAAEFPLVFDAMALTWQEVTTLKKKIRDNCPAVDGEAFRRAPGANMRCRRAP